MATLRPSGWYPEYGEVLLLYSSVCTAHTNGPPLLGAMSLP